MSKKSSNKKSYYRNILTFFWDDSKVEQMSVKERYLFLYLLTNPHTNLLGIYEITKKQICNQTELDRKEIDVLLNKLHQLNMVSYDNKTNEVLIHKWSKHNWTISDDCLKGCSKQLQDVKSNELFEILNNSLLYTIYEIRKDSLERVYIGCKEKEEEEKEQEESNSESLKLNNPQLEDISIEVGMELKKVSSIYDECRTLDKDKQPKTIEEFKEYVKKH